MKKVLVASLMTAALLLGGCGGSNSNSNSGAATQAPTADNKAKAVQQFDKVKEDAKKLVENLSTAKENVKETAQKIETQLKEIEQKAKESGVSDKDIADVKAKLKGALSKLKK